MRKARLAVTSIIVIALATGGIMIATPALQSWQLYQAKDDPAELSRLRLDGVATVDRLADEIGRAVAANDLDLAESFVALGVELGIAVAPEQLAPIEILRKTALVRAASDFGHGFVAGERESDAAFAGALVGDISGFGDLRDLALEGRKVIGGAPADETVLALAAVGLAITAATWVSFGGGLPARGGLSAVKAASKAKRLSPVLTANLGRMAAGALDRPALATSLAAAARFDLAAVKVAAGGIVRPAALARFTTLGQDAGALYARTGQRGLRQVLAVAEDAGDVRRAAKLAAKRRAAAARAKARPLQILPPPGEAEETPAQASGPAIGLLPPPASSESRGAVVSIILVGLGALAIALLAMALIPAHLAPWYWVENLLAGRRQQFAISGVMSLVAAGIFFAFTFLSG